MTIFHLNPAKRHDIGGLLTVVPEMNLTGPDPFLFIAHHGPQNFSPNNQGLPFDEHPHKGFETITFVRQGSLSHYDSHIGERSVDAGGVQWMTAGKGIVHNEFMPDELKKNGGMVEILQLWLNLPNALKHSNPNYIGLQADEIPSKTSQDGKAKIDIVAGEFDGVKGGMQSLTGATMTAITLQKGGEISLTLPQDDRAIFFYLAQGELSLDGQTIPPLTRVAFEQISDKVQVLANQDSYFLFGHAPNIHEPVVAQGPFVMSSREEISQAIREYQAGLFR